MDTSSQNLRPAARSASHASRIFALTPSLYPSRSSRNTLACVSISARHTCFSSSRAFVTSAWCAPIASSRCALTCANKETALSACASTAIRRVAICVSLTLLNASNSRRRSLMSSKSSSMRPEVVWLKSVIAAARTETPFFSSVRVFVSSARAVSAFSTAPAKRDSKYAVVSARVFSASAVIVFRCESTSRRNESDRVFAFNKPTRTSSACAPVACRKCSSSVLRVKRFTEKHPRLL
mmetsp:Transcript_10172/g.37676  ORF Transcript_10172/g.37676 Transcript_10172/m.37676 type:complete len:237 (-) Transcript_10172:289-999(-)